MQNSRLLSAVWLNVSAKRAFSSTTKATQRFYEYRTYTIKPKHFNQFIQLTNEHIHLRTAHSKLLGYWVSEYGGLNEVNHIWQYDNHGHRTAVRAALASDENWLSSYITKALSMIEKQDNAILYPFSWYNVVEKPILEQGVYEMRQHTVLPSKLAQFSHRFQQGVEDRNKYSQLIGIWYSEFGELNRVYHLWHYRTPDERMKIRETAEKDEMWSETIRDCKLFLSSMSSKLLVPTKFSPLK
ncbi:protein NipSnap homolog 3B-like [Dendronephthya gigantea]|uniref:protein NipSnap homolog 3B-like n=1 Tax=Dendronephthya gigantea TaxID=151771 RepID=UPI00106AC217|nr:protein NipSnap homolog 3B-like [Dendronephthya gigantea]XP_028397176.1 protein NipSnap homolog 3B-like [Dendronephthya gigantea]XP_028397177.1 protein NipSnap homolog 3B-like [Dendronephthya gigantea]XP_028397178.1 protein NipSnap homolog 3B-like [Dendronephthya gigantea]